MSTKYEHAEELEKILDKLLHFWKRFELQEKIHAYVFNDEIFASIFVALGLSTCVVPSRCTFLFFPALPNLTGSGPSSIWRAVPGNKDINHTVTQSGLLVDAELHADAIELLVDHKEGAWSFSCPMARTLTLEQGVIRAASPVEHPANSTMGGVFHKVRPIFPLMSTIFEWFDGVQRGGSDERQPTSGPTGKCVHFESGSTPSPTISTSTLPSSLGLVTPPPIVAHTVLVPPQTPFWNWDMSYPITRINLPSDIWTQAATQPAVGSMDIICKLLPWHLTIYPRLQGSYVTVADVFDSLHRALSTSDSSRVQTAPR